jgi:glycosyltransferase involved in cell wall biosynthesis
VELIVHGVSGFHAASRDAGDLAEKLGWLMRDPALRAHIASEAVRRARTYEWDIVLSQLFDAYDEIVAGHPAHLRARAA